MSHGEIAAIFAGFSVLALALLVPAIKRARAENDVGAACALAFATGLFFSLPDALVAVTGRLQRRPDAFGDLIVINPSWYHRLDELSIALLAALVAYLLLRFATTTRVRVHTAGVVAILLWAVSHLSAGLRGGSPVTSRGAVLLLSLLAATVLPRGRGAAVGVGVFGVTLAIASGLLAPFRYDVAFVVPCQGACSGLGFTGVLPNENLLGIVLTASIPFAYLGFRGRARFWLCLYLAGMAIATGSRTAVLGSVISLVALLLVRPRLDADRATPGRTATAWLVLAGAATSSIYVVRHHWSPSALATRPMLWGVAWHYIRRSPWFGYGPEKWASLYRSSEIPVAAQRTSHNQWTDVLFVSGGVGAALFIGMALIAIWTSGRGRGGVLLVLATILTIGTTEGTWSIGSLDLMSFSLVAFILTGATNQSGWPDPSGRGARPGLASNAPRARLPARQIAHGAVPDH